MKMKLRPVSGVISDLEGDKKMNAHIQNVIMDICKVDGVLYAMDRVFEGIKFTPESLETADHLSNMISVARDEIERLKKDMEYIEADGRIVDVLQAVRK